MKNNRSILLALIVLIFLVAWLIVISLEKSRDSQMAVDKVSDLQTKLDSLPQPITPKDGKTPILGVDYFNGKDSKSTNTIIEERTIEQQPGKDGESAYEIAVRHGFVGTEAEWLASLKSVGPEGSPGRDIDIECIDGTIGKKYLGDVFWQLTNIICETKRHE